ncbi:MAG: Calcium-transporting ATPase 1 [Eubacteriales bacterium SKADARSKE-1]|nr:Calcium-transporting ATPase 1 [Eubacteriales bacterium SKADARSKE-1]
MDWHNLSCDEILKKFNVKKDVGLNNMLVAQLQEKYGKNRLKEKKSKSLFSKFIAQFSDFMIIILLIAAVVSFITDIIKDSNDFIDPIIILFIVVMNAIIGVVQENKAEKAIEALKKLSSPKTKVIRSGKEVSILSEEIVPGDILVLNSGDLVPADSRIIESYGLYTEESSLTGESLPILKEANLVLPKNLPVADRKNMVFSGSIITAGHALAIAVKTGMNTEVGKIAGLINKEESPQTPLQKKLEKTGKILGIGITAICFFIFILGVIQKVNTIDMFMIAISLAVAAIPEGLPAVVTIVLALGLRRMAANKAIIRKLSAVETLGSATVICSDKTGTLTQNKMTVKKLFNHDGIINFTSKSGENILSLGALCNNSIVSGEKENFKVSGEPTEISLLEAYNTFGHSKRTLDKSFPRVYEFPFSSSRKLMTTVHKLPSGKFRVITKGAPEVLLSISNRLEEGPLANSIRQKIKFQNENMAKEALRVLAVGYKDVSSLPKSQSEAEKDLVFCGLIGMIDPPRPEAKLAVADCKKAGIRPVMITGDHIATATAIAKELGIYNKNDLAITGTELDSLDEKTFQKNVFKYSVFARVSPEHKVKIVKAFQKNGAVVAMTGDGVNDAPALKAADIGCAMGKSGTDVAKSAADMILTDDNFSTIVEAVKQGRGIFQNIKKAIHFLLSTNIGEIVAVLTAFLLKLPSPLLAIQLLWINLVTDSLPALALGVDPVGSDIMNKPPIKPESGLFSHSRWHNIITEGCFIGSISLLAFTIGRIFFDVGSTPVIGRTMTFAVMSLSQIIHAFNIRSEESIFKTGILGNMSLIYSFMLCVILQVSVISLPFLTTVFKTVCLDLTQWLIVAGLSLSPLILVEIEKRFAKQN